jgi:hypothetical protein
MFPILESYVLLVGSVTHGPGVYDACSRQGGEHFDVEAVFDVYAFAERQRVAQDQDLVFEGPWILLNESLAVLITSDAPLVTSRIDPRCQKIRRTTPSRSRIGSEDVITLGVVMPI